MGGEHVSNTTLSDWTATRWAGCSLVLLACGLGLVGWVRTTGQLPLSGFVVGVVFSSVMLSAAMAILLTVTSVVPGLEDDS